MSSLSLLLKPVRVAEPKGGRVVRKLGMHEKAGRKPNPETVEKQARAAALAAARRAEAEQRSKRFQEAVRLRDSQRRAMTVVLKEQPGLTTPQLAFAAGVPMCSVHSVLSRLRRDGVVVAKRKVDEDGHSGLRWYAVVPPSMKREA